MVQNKPQCVACGIASNSLEKPLCNGCIRFYSSFFHLSKLNLRLHYYWTENGSDVPMALLNVKGIFALLAPGGDSGDYDGSDADDNQTREVLNSARAYQKQASDTRLTRKPNVAQGANGGINLHKNLEKAINIKKEKKNKYDESKLVGHGIRLAATLWKVDSLKNNKLVEVLCLIFPSMSIITFPLLLR